MNPKPDPVKIAKHVEDFIANGTAVNLAPKRYADPDNVYAGLSYIAAEVVYHACGGLKSGLRVWTLQTGEPEVHCFLKDSSGKVIDPTARQYPGKVDYSTARKASFISTCPSARCLTLAGLVGISF